LADILFHPAAANDSSAIKELIHLVRINPMSLDWERFLLASTPDGKLVACGQIKPHSEGTLELASIAVHPDWRGRGLAREIIQRLLADSTRPVYLTCRSDLEPFYIKFGFRSLSSTELTPYFRRIQKLANLMMFREGFSLSVMRLD
jgi:N-acetylglutamate synthase-like GNAT family acetyltransferase